jgi:hypothetical protein
MQRYPADIYTEPEPDPDTLANLGPLSGLAGIWSSDDGHDVAPKADGPEPQQFIERYELQPIDAQTNGPQLLYGLRYHTRIVQPAAQDCGAHAQSDRARGACAAVMGRTAR